MLSDFLCESHLKSGQLVRLFPEVEIQKWQLFLYHPYETVTPPRVLKVFEMLEGILKGICKNALKSDRTFVFII